MKYKIGDLYILLKSVPIVSEALGTCSLYIIVLY